MTEKNGIRDSERNQPAGTAHTEIPRWGKIVFAGAGPGAADLISVRAAEKIAEADLIVYAGSLVNPEIPARYARPDAEQQSSANLSLDQVIALMTDRFRRGWNVMRLHTGDPSIYGAVAEQFRELKKNGIDYECIPGISSVFAAAAALGTELTMNEISQTVILTRMGGRTPVPEKESLETLAAHGTTIALFLSAGAVAETTAALIRGGRSPETPAAAVSKASWPDQQIVRGTLGDLANQMNAAGMRRQSMILVGEVLRGDGGKSCLYDPGFRHGYRAAACSGDAPGSQFDALPPAPRFAGSLACFATTARAVEKALELLNGLASASRKKIYLPERLFPEMCRIHPGAAHCFDSFPSGGGLSKTLERIWRDYDAFLFLSSAGIALRAAAPLLESKYRDPALLVMDEAGKYVVSLLSGHLGGANALALEAAGICNAQAVLTTASDLRGFCAFDELARRHSLRILNPELLLPLSAALLDGKRCAVLLDDALYDRYYASRAEQFPRLRPISSVSAGDGAGGGSGTDETHFAFEDWNVVLLHSEAERARFSAPDGKHLLFLLAAEAQKMPKTEKTLVLGVGMKKDASCEALEALAEESLRRIGGAFSMIRCVAAPDLKQKEAGLLAFCRKHSLELCCFPAERLNAIDVPNPSRIARERLHLNSASEASALCCAGPGAQLLLEKQRGDGVTLAIAAVAGGQESPTRSVNAANSAVPDFGQTIYAVGLGPGAADLLTPRAERLIRAADTIAGYGTYLDLFPDLFRGKRLIRSGMTRELERCRAALDAVKNGEKTVMVCSGDPGIYGMSGLLLELCDSEEAYRGIRVVSVPGISAANAGAAVAGAPLMNDFAVLSLSDLMTGRERILTRLRHAAEGDYVTVLYNPASRLRRELLRDALALFQRSASALRPGLRLPFMLLRNIEREGQERICGFLEEFPFEKADMLSLLILGNSESVLRNGVLYNPRGYRAKYGSEQTGKRQDGDGE